ncbi:MAG: DNA mismatch repair protein MutS [Rhodospirillales bacterium]|nr:DNA mismatch repair protein MutS [Rhodospirillales bacterium]
MEDSSVAERERQTSRARAPAGRTGAPVDQDVWRAFTQGIAPIKGRERAPAERAPVVLKIEPKPAVRRAVPVPPPPQPKAPALPELKPGASPGVDRRTADRLRRGEFAIDVEIDLHGHTLEEAYRALAISIEKASAAGHRCVLVITGHGVRSSAGRGALREALPRWLNEPALRPRILTLAPAQPKHGGQGAFYVLLKRRRGQIGKEVGEK